MRVHRAVHFAIAAVVATVTSASVAAAQQIPTPEEHFGFAMGTDKELARWDEILDYFTLIGDASGRIQIDTAGPTTLGNPFISVTITSPANLARLGEIRAASAAIAEGRISRA